MLLLVQLRAPRQLTLVLDTTDSLLFTEDLRAGLPVVWNCVHDKTAVQPASVGQRMGMFNPVAFICIMEAGGLPETGLLCHEGNSPIAEMKILCSSSSLQGSSWSSSVIVPPVGKIPKNCTGRGRGQLHCLPAQHTFLVSRCGMWGGWEGGVGVEGGVSDP